MRHLVSGNARLVSSTGKSYRCALGRSGISEVKFEGDGATPAGLFPLRGLFYRPDRLDLPQTGLRVLPLEENMGWCDAPRHPSYNRLVRLPFDASHEKMWRDDGLYDLVVVLGHNDDPPRANRGSAIFMHIARDGYAPTEGCVALSREDLLDFLKDAIHGDDIEISL